MARLARPSSWYNLDLYTNDHTPAPGDEAGDYVIPTSSQWPGYIGVQLPASDWSQPSVSNDVAQTYQPDPAVFTFPSGVGSFSLYGYFVTDGYGNLIWAEEFDAPVAASYPGGLSVVAYFNIGILPSDSDSFAARVIGRADDDDDERE